MAPLLPRAVRTSSELRSFLSSTASQLVGRKIPSYSQSPSKTLNPRTLASVLRRQQVTVTASSSPNPIIPATYSGLNTGPSPGEVVGIVFGSVAGFLLILWLIYTCFSFTGAAPQSSVVEEEITVRRRSRSPRPPPSNHSRSEVIEVSRTRERSRSRSISRSSPRSPPQRESTRRETVIIEETRRPSRPPPQDDIVEVIEDHDSPVRQSRKSSKRVSSGFRTVDPNALGGGDRPMRKVSRP